MMCARHACASASASAVRVDARRRRASAPLVGTTSTSTMGARRAIVASPTTTRATTRGARDVFARARTVTLAASRDARETRVGGRETKDQRVAVEARDDAWWASLARVAGTSALALAITLGTIMVNPGDALAARSGGRIGGGSFRASSMGSMRSLGGGSSYGSYSAPSPGGMRTSSFMLGPGFGYGMMGPGMYFGGGGMFNIIFMMMMVTFIMNALQNMMGNGGFGDGLTAGGDSISVVKIQVGLLGTARALQKDLERIANKADTSSPDGLHYVLEETVLALLRNPEYCVYGFATSKVCRGPEQAEETFNDFSLDERGKFEKETLVNVNARKKTASVGGAPSEETNDYILVTILAACDGGVKMPEITDSTELKTALKRLGAVRVEALQAVEVLWTPQEDGDSLTSDELLRDYPRLAQL